jgi:hypothetical protein
VRRLHEVVIVASEEPTRANDSHSSDSPSAEKGEAQPEKKEKKKRSRWRKFFVVLLVLGVLLGIGRAMLPWAVRQYVNRTLDKSPLYQGRIGSVELHLWRGAYSIHDVRIVKITGDVPVPLFASDRVEFHVQWNALAHGRVVGGMLMEKPELNFVDAPDPADAQTGAGGPWLQIIRELFPFKINSAQVKDGSVHFRTFAKEQAVDVYLSHLDATVDNLTNINNESTPLVTTVKATAMAMDQARFEYNMTLDPFSYRPTFHMAVRLLGLDVTSVNNLARAYGAFDFKRGWFDLVIETDSKEGQVSGYVKPLFRNLKVFSLKQDIKEDNVLQFFWQALIGTGVAIFKNQPRDQFGTLIPFTGSDIGTQPDIFATIGNILRNAFIRAYLPRLQPDAVADQFLQFEPPSPIDPANPGE